MVDLSVFRGVIFATRKKEKKNLMSRPTLLQGCLSPTQKPETDEKNMKKCINLNQNSQKWAENK